jgi:hypothetical protein
MEQQQAKKPEPRLRLSSKEESKIIELTLDPWHKAEFYELDKTVDLVSNFH